MVFKSTIMVPLLSQGGTPFRTPPPFFFFYSVTVQRFESLQNYTGNTKQECIENRNLMKIWKWSTCQSWKAKWRKENEKGTLSWASMGGGGQGEHVPHKFSRGHNIKYPPTILGLYDYSLNEDLFHVSSPALWGPCLLACHRGWWRTRIPLPRPQKMLKKEKSVGVPPPPPPPPPLISFFRTCATFEAGGGPKKTKHVSPHGLVRIDAHVPFHCIFISFYTTLMHSLKDEQRHISKYQKFSWSTYYKL